MRNQSQYGETMLLESLRAASSAQKLKRMHFTKGSDGHAYDEAWLQNLLKVQPGLLPVARIEPAFGDLIPVCRELPMAAGFADNLFVTASGNIALVECKLWRNPGSRREVIAQIVDYASELTTWDYEKFDAQIRLAPSFGEHHNRSPRGLFDTVVADAGDVDESAFHDAISRNLRLGKFLLLIVGDGIQEGITAMTEYLQKYAGLHFTLSVVEMALFELPSGEFIVQPRVLAQTQNIIRAVIKLDDSRLLIAQDTVATESASIRRANITEEDFFWELERNSPGTPAMLTSFLGDLDGLNIRPDFGSRTLTLRWIAEDLTWNLGTIVNSGEVWMDYHATQAWNRHVVDESKRYLERLAALVPGASVIPTKLMNAWNVISSKGQSLRLSELLSDSAHKDDWRDAIQRFELEVAREVQD